MYKKLWLDIHRSVCSITFLEKEKENGKEKEVRISSGSGFRVGKRILTNNHVFQAPSSSTHVAIRFVEADGHSTATEKRFPISDFKHRLLEGDPEIGWDFAIMEFNEFDQIPSLTLRNDDDIEIGSAIALFGFQFDQSHLSLHTGILSSKYPHAGVNYLQLDASVNKGNSGGPLIFPETGEVIGIVTRKEPGLTDQFNKLIASFDNNVKVLQATATQGSVSILGVNPLEALIATQVQMRQVSLEIERSANVGVGYAYELQKVRRSFALNS